MIGFAMSWQLVDSAAPDPTTAPAISCAKAGVATILIDAVAGATNTHNHHEFACADLEGVTPPLAEDTYQLLAKAADSSGKALSQTTFSADNYTTADADLGLTIFQITLK